MKNYISLLLIAVGFSSYAQVGVNTSNPQQKFHVDGKNTAATINPLSGVPSAAQAVDDVVITSTGKVGTGTVNPATRLDINNGSNNGAIKITDGTQGAGKLLMSDDTGIGKWVLPNPMKGVVVGNFAKTSSGTGMVVTSNGSGHLYSNVSITLTKGTWMVNMGLTLKSFLMYNSGRWVHFKLSSTNTGVTYNGWKIWERQTIIPPTLVLYLGALFITVVMFSSIMKRMPITTSVDLTLLKLQMML